jgi:chromosome segregation ATPase
MTRSEYQELVEFLGPKFEAIDRRFDAIDRRFEAIDRRLDGLEVRLTRVEVGVEENRHQIQLLAEGVTAVDQKLERFREETREEFRGVRSEMAGGFASVWSEFGNVRREMAQGFQAQGRLLN